jgi:hypothetical protein
VLVGDDASEDKTGEVARGLHSHDPRMPRLQDFDLWIRLLKHHGFRYVPVEQFSTVRHSDGISKQDDRLNRAGEG